MTTTCGTTTIKTGDLDDWLFFKSHRDRAYRCRLATPREIDGLAAHGCIVAAEFEGERFVHCIGRKHGENIERIFLAIGALGDIERGPRL